MFRVFQEEKLITICMFAFLGSSILLRVFLGLLYRNMIKEADNMASTRNRLLKQCKTKFASCYQLGNGVANIPVFVDKFLNRMTLGHLSFETIYHLSGQLMLLSVVFSGIGVCKSIIGGRTVGEVLPFYIVSFFGLYVYFSVSTVVDVRGKKRMLKINLVDYLENHLSPRIEVTRQDMEMLYGEAAFEEKQMPRIQGGRKERARSRRGKKSTQAKPEKRRTVELMPIENRMAAGGDVYQGAGRAEQTYPSGRQTMWAGSPQQMRQMSRTEDEKMGMQVSRADGAGAAEYMPGTERGARLSDTEDRQWKAQAEDGERSTVQMTGAENGRQAGNPQTKEAARIEQGCGIPERSWEEQEQRPAEGAWAERGQQTPEGAWAERGQQTPEDAWAERGQQTPEGAWAERGQQTPEGAWAEQEKRTGDESPEDSAAVTEEELEALLKEFLTT